MEQDAKSRVDTSVPKPDAAEHLSEKEKRAMELQDETEHSHGTQRERLATAAKDLAAPGKEAS